MRLDNSDLIAIRDRAKAVWHDIKLHGNPDPDELTGTEEIIADLDTAVKERRVERFSKQDDEEMQKFLDGCIGAVEANSFERHALWRFNDEKMDGRKLVWKQHNSGLMTCAGIMGGKQTWLSLLTAEVGGHKILFYYSSGTFTDHDAARAWIDGSMPLSARDGIEGGRVNHTDAMNFHNIFSYRMELTYAD